MDSRDTLGRLAGGHFFDEVSLALMRVSEEVLAIGRKGTVTIRLEVTRPQTGDVLVTIQEQISVALPKPPGMGAVFYLVDGAFHTRDPRQIPLPQLTVVETPAKEPGAAGADQHKTN